MVKFLNGGNLFTKPSNWIFGKIQFFEKCRREFHFCRREIDYTTFASAFFCRREMILVRKTEPGCIWSDCLTTVTTPKNIFYIRPYFENKLRLHLNSSLRTVDPKTPFSLL